LKVIDRGRIWNQTFNPVVLKFPGSLEGILDILLETGNEAAIGQGKVRPADNYARVRTYINTRRSVRAVLK
jgi:hypothetical protein